jgi:putative transposase
VVSGSRRVDAKDIEILVLRHQLEIISRKKGKRFRSEDKVLLAALSRLLPRDRWRSFVVHPRPC